MVKISLSIIEGGIFNFARIVMVKLDTTRPKLHKIAEEKVIIKRMKTNLFLKLEEMVFLKAM